MKKALSMILAVVLLASFLSSFGEEEKQWNDEYLRVSDLTKTITNTDLLYLDNMITDFMKEYKQDIVVLMMPFERLDGMTPEEFGKAYFTESGFGYGDDREGYVFVYLTDKETVTVAHIGAEENNLLNESYTETIENMIPGFKEKYGYYYVAYGCVYSIKSLYEPEEKSEDTNKADTGTDNHGSLFNVKTGEWF